MARRPYANDSSAMSHFLGGAGMAGSKSAGSIDYVKANRERIADIEGFASHRAALAEMPASPPKSNLSSKYEHVTSRLAAVGATTRPAVRSGSAASGDSAENGFDDARAGSAGSTYRRRTGSAASTGRRPGRAVAEQPLPSKFTRPEVLPKKPSVPTRDESLPMPSHEAVNFVARNAGAAGRPSYGAPSSPGRRHFPSGSSVDRHHGDDSDYHPHHQHSHYERDSRSGYENEGNGGGLRYGGDDDEGLAGEGRPSSGGGYDGYEGHHHSSSAGYGRGSATGRVSGTGSRPPAWGAGPGLTARPYDPLMQGTKVAPLAASSAGEVGSGIVKHAEYAGVPKYLKERQAEWKAVEEAKKRAEADKDIPKGMRVMGAEEKAEMLTMLREGIKEAQDELRTFKLVLTVPSQIKRKADLEAKLSKMQEAVGTFSKDRVFVKK